MILKKDVIVIGGGPIGLYFANLLEKENIDYLLLEASDKLGGQPLKLYPEKYIDDLNDFSHILARDFVNKLIKNIDLKNVKLNEKACRTQLFSEKVLIETSKNSYTARVLVIATGLGFYTPRKMNLEGENVCQNILYSLNDFSFLKNKKVAIFGGGDSALDWAKHVSLISNDVHLIHRRHEFRGDASTIKNSKNLIIHKPFIPYKLKIKENLATNIIIQEVGNETNLIDLPIDYILVNYGSIPSKETFGFKSDGVAILVDDDFKINERIFVIGDASSYPNKKRRLQSGIAEADAVIKKLII